MKPYNLVLSSNSPRRSELLKKAGLDFTIRTIEIDETFPDDLECEKVAEYISNLKADAHRDKISKHEVILTADTVVAYDGIIYGKPRTRDEAIEFILTFSAQVHQVYTGVTFLNVQNRKSFTTTSNVKFDSINSDEAAYYVDNFNAMDKAGAYGIQDWIGQVKVEWIEGSYTNIVGLPLVQVCKNLKLFVAALKES